VHGAGAHSLWREVEPRVSSRGHPVPCSAIRFQALLRVSAAPACTTATRSRPSAESATCIETSVPPFGFGRSKRPTRVTERKSLSSSRRACGCPKPCAGHATCRYSWSRPLRRSCRRTLLTWVVVRVGRGRSLRRAGPRTCSSPSGDPRFGAAWELPVRSDDVAGVTAGVAFEVVLVFGFGLPEAGARQSRGE
jgi:hypothetical protein